MGGNIKVMIKSIDGAPLIYHYKSSVANNILCIIQKICYYLKLKVYDKIISVVFNDNYSWGVQNKSVL